MPRNLPNLFKSSGQNGSELQPTRSVDAINAEQRWPLLKAMPPKEPQPTPALTTQELRLWQSGGSNDQTRPTTPNAPPGLGELLALGLKKMSTRARAVPRTEGTHSEAAVPMPPQSSPLASVAHLATEVEETQPAHVPEIKIAGAGVTFEAIFRKEEPSAEVAAPNITTADDSLKSVFSRIEGKQRQAGSSIGAKKTPSYLSRLGRK